MDNLQLYFNPEVKQRKWKKFTGNIHRLFFVEKLYNIPGFIFLALIAGILTFEVSKSGFVFGVLATIGILAVPAVVALVLHPQFGILMYISLAYAIMFLLRLGVTFPLGTLMDGMLLLFFLGFFIQQKKKPQWGMVQGPASKWILIWIIYNFIVHHAVDHHGDARRVHGHLVHSAPLQLRSARERENGIRRSQGQIPRWSVR